MNITQLRRLVFRKWNGSSFDVFTMEADDLGQDAVLTLNVAPRKRTRASSRGTTETPIAGTYDTLTASATFLADNFKLIGKALQRWNEATYEGHKDGDGNVIFGGNDENLCKGEEYLSVVAQGVCDNGSDADIEIARCVPSIDDDMEFGTSDTPTITLNLNPIIYNPAIHDQDGYEKYDVRLGTHTLATNERLDASTGSYSAVGA